MKIQRIAIICAAVLCTLLVPSQSAAMPKRSIAGSIVGEIEEVVEGIENTVEKAIETVNATLAGLVSGAASLADGIVKNLVQNALKEAVNLVPGGNATVESLLNCTGVEAVVKNVTTTVQSLASNCVINVFGPINTTISTVEGILTSANNLLSEAQKELNSCSDLDLICQLTSGTEVFANLLSTVTEDAEEVTEAVESILSDTVSSLLKDVVSCLSTATSSLQSTVSGAINEAVKATSCVTSIASDL